MDVASIALAGVRFAISTLLDGKGAYPSVPWDVQVLNFRDNSGQMILPPILEDEFNSSGSSVTGIIASAEQQGQDRITDVDRDALEGMAIIEAVVGLIKLIRERRGAK